MCFHGRTMPASMPEAFTRKVSLMTIRIVTLFVGMSMMPTAADAMTLAPHQAVYDLFLSSQTSGFANAEGRIAMQLKTDKCGVYAVDYRFVAKFEQDQEITLTDQQTQSTENEAGTAFQFTTKTFVDGSPEKEIRGEATREGDATKVMMKAPEAKTFDLPPSHFPMQHTIELIAKAKAGEHIVETRLFDGDDDAQKLLTSTAIISPNPAATPQQAAVPKPPAIKNAAAAAAQAVSPQIGKALAGLRSWRISESYYNSDSDPDGMAVFQTSYVLYENGVSDDLKLDFGNYVFNGSLSKLDLFDASSCR